MAIADYIALVTSRAPQWAWFLQDTNPFEEAMAGGGGSNDMGGTPGTITDHADGPNDAYAVDFTHLGGIAANATQTTAGENTIEFWVRLDTATGAYMFVTLAPFITFDDAFANGRIRTVHQGRGIVGTTIGNVLNTPEINHYVYTCGAVGCSAYLNGVLDSFYGASPGVNDGGTSVIAGSNDGSAPLSIDGQMTCIALYDRVLTAPEIAANYAAMWSSPVVPSVEGDLQSVFERKRSRQTSW
jgi:hypothetical protein